MDLRDAVITEGRFNYFAAQDTVILLQTPLATFKICRLSFGSDGSIYVMFPYCKEKTGILNKVARPGGPSESITHNLGTGGKLVPTDVKFSHHRSGVAQFSKTREVEDAPRHNSFPLDGPIGHVFDLHIFWPSGFDLLEKPKKRDLHLAFGVQDRHPAAFLVAGQWRRKQDLLNNTDPPNGIIEPTATVTHRKTGLPTNVYFLGQPEGYPLRDHVLMLSGGEIPLPTGAEETGMVFMGGWNSEREGLVFMYPGSGRPKGTVPSNRRAKIVRTLIAIVLAVVLTVVVYLIAYPLLTLWDVARGNTSWLQTLFMGAVAPGLGGAAGYFAADRLIKRFDRKIMALGYSLVVLVSGVELGSKGV